MKEKQGFVLYRSFYKPIKGLPEKDKSALLDAIFLYHENGDIPELSPAANMAFEFMKETFSLDAKKYKKRCEKNRENINKRWSTTEYERIQSNNSNTKDTDIDMDMDLDIELDKKKNNKKKFRKPSIDEIREYCRERNNNIDPEQFFDHYETSGWKRGKTPIKDWKACIRTWERNSTQENGNMTEMREF